MAANSGRNISSFLFKASILCISIDTSAAGIISGAIPAVEADFSNVPSSLVESISTLPSLAILIFIALSPLLTGKLGYKKVALIGLAISFIAGVMPFFATNIYMVLVCRFFFGAGIGLLNPMAFSIVSYFYVGNERAQMLGLIGTVSSLSSTLLTMLAGVLLKISWRASFLSYSIILIIFFLVMIILPEMDISSNTSNESIWTRLGKLSKRVYLFFAYYAVLQLMLEGMIVKYGLLITGKGFGSATSASFVMSFMSITGMIVGIIFAPVFKVLKNSLLPIAIAAMSAALIGMSFTNSLMVSAILLIIVTAAFTFAPAFLYYQIAEVAPKSLVNFCNSVMLIFVNVSVFLTPYIYSGIAKISGNASPSAALVAAGVIGIVLLILVLAVMKFAPRKQQIKDDSQEVENK
ncbi:MFS transporter [Paucilactobacillus suebicus]|uniref:Major facilitator superfamily protein n=1 Tax=Paucilactobacillus suebicus DSM 5007 = KCTC 3549 TaxID=1423807 RepID=A0A0R1W491_9LACO|nr:MFS transporter [Paucilactobacillus suebicus]KRM12616.1 major facilitator superfamily protein [Paucilactobacillus suebicus DSM 5007 = KCTC 3549]